MVEHHGRGRVFLSHSSRDKEAVLQVAERLSREAVWVDVWELEAGEVLPQALAEAVDTAKDFVLFASEHALSSKWVRFELGIIMVRWIEQADARIIVFRLDDTPLPPELRPLVNIDARADFATAVEQLVSTVHSAAGRPKIKARERRRRFVNRFAEIAAIERLFHESVPFIVVEGLHGIGKTSLVERAAHDVFDLPVARINITSGHGLLRFALELSARAGVEMPRSDTTESDLVGYAGEAAIALMQRGHIVFFDDVEFGLDDEGRLKDYLSSVLLYIASQVQVDVPILLASSRRPQFNNASLKDLVHHIRVGPLANEDLVYCLENWLAVSDPTAVGPSRDMLRQAAAQLFGYPLGARLAAFYIANYSIEYLLEQLYYFTDIRVDIAKQLLGRLQIELNSEQVTAMHVLALTDDGLNLEELASAMACSPEQARTVVDTLIPTMLLGLEGGVIRIHPIVRDYFWRQLFDQGGWRDLASAMAEQAEAQLAAFAPESAGFIRVCSRAYTLYAISGQLQRAQDLAYDLKEQLREVGIRLYHARETARAREYLDLWIEAAPHDRDARWYLARCLTRLGKYDKAEGELDRLRAEQFPPYRLNHALGLLRRDQRNLPAAMRAFQDGLDDRPTYVPLLRDYADVLDRLGRTTDALTIARRAYDIAPRDTFVVPKYVDLLAKSGDIDTALGVLKGALTAFPDQGAFLHRMATVLVRHGRESEALDYARRAHRAQPHGMPEISLHLAMLEDRVGSRGRAQSLIAQLPADLSRQARLVRDTMQAEQRLRAGDIDGARQCLSAWDVTDDPVAAHVLIRAELADATKLWTRGDRVPSRGRLDRADSILTTSLMKHPRDRVLLELKAKVDDLRRQFT